MDTSARAAPGGVRVGDGPDTRVPWDVEPGFGACKR